MGFALCVELARLAAGTALDDMGELVLNHHPEYFRAVLVDNFIVAMSHVTKSLALTVTSSSSRK